MSFQPCLNHKHQWSFLILLLLNATIFSYKVEILKLLLRIYTTIGVPSVTFQTYSMDTYFRQTWNDKRLAFNVSDKELLVSTKVLNDLWKPDTYFYNGQGSYLHTTTVPNKLVRLSPDGSILYSMR